MDPGSCNSFNGSEDEEDDDESGMEELQEEESYERGEIVPSSFGVGNRMGVAGELSGATNNELEKFRRQWKSEINSQSLSSRAQSSPFATEEHLDDLLTSNNDDNNNTEDNNAGVNAEELRVALSVLEGGKKPTKGDECNPPAADDDDIADDEKEKDGSDEDDGEDCDTKGGLKSVRIAIDSVICKPAYRQEAAHISDLPLEVLDLIFKWVVSSYLDVRSLEMLSMVCKSFYLLARGEDLWKAVCMRTWEKSSLSPGYSSYRQMFVERPHVMFNGCYISKATYFRAGEKSFDGFYRPFHLVKYYRYIRFYPEGKVYMFMSPEQPKKAVAYLRSKSNYVHGLQYGYYKLSDDKVSLVLKKIPEPSSKPKRFSKNLCYYADYEQTFFLEMSLKSTKRRRNWQLNWLKYFMHRVNKSTNESSTMTFDISDNMYPPFYFYPVRSFAAQSEFPL